MTASVGTEDQEPAWVGAGGRGAAGRLYARRSERHRVSTWSLSCGSGVLSFRTFGQYMARRKRMYSPFCHKDLAGVEMKDSI